MNPALADPNSTAAGTEQPGYFDNWNAPGLTSCNPSIPTANRNQNVYTARLYAGVEMGALDNSRPAGTLRAYAVFVRNATHSSRRFAVQTTQGSFSYQDACLTSNASCQQTSLVVDVPPLNTAA